MALIRWNLAPELGAAPVAPATGFAPPADVAVARGDVVLTMDLPGLTAADVEIDIDDGVLSVRGHRPAPPAQGGTRCAHRERRFGSFERHLQLPDGVEPDAITASMEHGVLSLLVPRPVQPEPTRIKIAAKDTEPAREKTRRFSLDGISAELLKAPRRAHTQ